MLLYHFDETFMAEMVLWQTNIELLRLVDYRKTISLQSHTIFIFHNETDPGSNLK
jgi:hypothetical protein